MEKLAINPNIEEASTLPATFYTSSAWYDLAKEKIFAKSWQYGASAEDLHLTGQMLPLTLLPGVLDEPILFVRDTEGMLHCISNVCTHRGNILIEAPCLGQQIRCRYHGRRFQLNGEFMHMPEFATAKNFPSANDHLPKVAFDQLGQFIFASISPKASFDDTFDIIKKRLFWFPLDALRLDVNRSRNYLVKSHWALYCENYLEGLHIPFVHQSLRSVLDFGSYSTELYRYANLQLALGNTGDECFDLPPNSPDYGKKVAAYYYWIFPNTMLNFYPWGCSVNIVKPLGVSLTKVSFLTFVWDESKMESGAGGDLDKVEREDEAIVESVQKGIRSRLYVSGRYSPTMEQGTHHFHQLLCEFLNS